MAPAPTAVTMLSKRTREQTCPTRSKKTCEKLCFINFSARGCAARLRAKLQLVESTMFPRRLIQCAVWASERCSIRGDRSCV